jgi:AcrR family transcriptional regulator
MKQETAAPVAPEGKVPRTERGRRTLRLLLDAAAAEFGERGFQAASISSITARAGTALGTFYTYFNSKEEIFRELVVDLSGQVRDHVRPHLEPGLDALDTERAALCGFLEFVREHKEVYRIIDEAEFVDHPSYVEHYQSTMERVLRRLREGAARGEVRPDVSEVHAWAIMGMNVFLGLRYGVWSKAEDIRAVADAANDLIRSGLRTRKGGGAKS